LRRFEQHSITSAREHADLLQSVRDDITYVPVQRSAFFGRRNAMTRALLFRRRCVPPRSAFKTSQRSEILLNERESIDRSHTMTNQILEYAQPGVKKRSRT